MRKSIHGQTERTIIIIQDLSEKQCTITLWGNISEDFNAQWMLTQEGTKILIVTSLTVRHYIRNFNLKNIVINNILYTN